MHALVRAYRLGQRRMNELVFGEVRAIDIAPATRLAVLEAITAIFFEYIDWIRSRSSWFTKMSVNVGWRIRTLSAASGSARSWPDRRPSTSTRPATSIRYPLRWHHLAVVMWYPDLGAEGDELARLQRFLRELAQAADAAMAPLFVAADRTTGWGWLPYRSVAADAVATIQQFATKRPASPSVAIGTMGAGVDGFRRSLPRGGSGPQRGGRGRSARTDGDCGNRSGLSAAALLGGDIGEAREWVRTVLGDLSADNENDARLRETLRVFLRCGSSYKQAAERTRPALQFGEIPGRPCGRPARPTHRRGPA